MKKHPNLAITIFGIFCFALILLASACSPTRIPDTEPLLPNINQEQIASRSEPAASIAPGKYLRFETITLEDGLSQSTIFCILQDSQGFMWFGTEDGLNKYDGYNFTVYKNDPEDPSSLGKNWIMALVEDDLGNLWIGTRDGGLNYFDRTHNRFIHYRHDPDNPDSLNSNRITALHLDQRGDLWIGSEEDGMDRLVLSTSGRDEGTDQENQIFIHYRHNPDDENSLSSNAVSAIHESEDGSLWVGTADRGLNRYDPQREYWEFFVNESSNPDSISHNEITTIIEDQSGILWIGTGGGGFMKYDQTEGRFIPYYPHPEDQESFNDITAINQDRDGTMWIGTWGGGLLNFDPENEIFKFYQNDPGDPHSLSSGIVYAILQDREGVYWFSINGVGINKLGLGRWNFAHYKKDPANPNSPNDDMIWEIYQEEEGDLWIGTMLGGVNRYDPETQIWNHYRHDPDDPTSLSSNWVWTIFEDSAGIFWIGNRSGLDRFDPHSDSILGDGAFTHFVPDPDGPPQSNSNKVTEIYEDSLGDFWIGTEGGVYRFDRKTESWSQTGRVGIIFPDVMRNAFIISIFEDQEGKLWFGTLGSGLGIYDPAMGTFAHYEYDPDDPLSLASNTVLAFFQDKDGVMWIGTQGGLERFEPQSKTFSQYREQDGLPNDVIYSILEDKQGYFWLSTNKGISRFDPHQETFKNYDVTDGLQSNEFNGKSSFVNERGDIYLGGIDGFNVFIPEYIQDNPTIPPIVLTSLMAGGKRVDLDPISENLHEVTLKWPDNALEFEYAALSFAHPEKNQYAYYLEGFEDTWNYVGTRRFGGYTNLPGGFYTLLIKGSNNDGVWNETGTAIKINVIPPFWATWWLRGIVILSILGIVYGGYHLRVRSLQAKERELAFQVELRTNELIETQKTLRKSEMEKAIATERNRLARELHDSVTQSLYSLTLFSEAARHLAEEQGLESIEKQINQIGVIGLQALKEMRLLVYELQPPELERDGLVRALRKRLDAVEGRAGIDARIEVEEFASLPGLVEQELFRIAQEALNNALKHAAAGSVVVHLRRENDRIDMIIVDDGVGFDPQSLSDSGGMGLKSIRERTERLGGVVDILTKPGDGTKIKVCIEEINEAEQRGEINE